MGVLGSLQLSLYRLLFLPAGYTQKRKNRFPQNKHDCSRVTAVLVSSFMLLAIQSHTHTIEILGCPLLCSFLHERLDEPRQLCVVFGRKWPHFGTPLAVACPLHPLQFENGRTFYHCLTLERIHTRQKGLRFLGFFFCVQSRSTTRR